MGEQGGGRGYVRRQRFRTVVEGFIAGGMKAKKGHRNMNIFIHTLNSFTQYET